MISPTATTPTRCSSAARSPAITPTARRRPARLTRKFPGSIETPMHARAKEIILGPARRARQDRGGLLLEFEIRIEGNWHIARGYPEFPGKFVRPSWSKSRPSRTRRPSTRRLQASPRPRRHCPPARSRAVAAASLWIPHRSQPHFWTIGAKQFAPILLSGPANSGMRKKSSLDFPVPARRVGLPP